MARRLLFGLFVAALAALPARGRAQVRTVAVLAVPAAPELDGEATRAQWGLVDGFSGNPRCEVVDLAARAEAGAVATRAMTTAQAKVVLAEAELAFDGLELARATQLASRAARFFEQGDPDQMFPGLVDALALGVLVHIAQRDSIEARNGALKLLALAPDFRVRPGRLTPEVAALFDEQRRRLSKGPKGRLEVLPEPRGAWVWVDGVSRGPGPTEIAGLMPGMHVVSAWAPGYELSTEKVFVEERTLCLPHLKLARLGAELLALADELKRGFAAGLPAEAAAALADWADADEALVVSLAAGGARVQATALRVAITGRLLARTQRAVAPGPTARGEWARLARDLFSGSGPDEKAAPGDDAGVPDY